MDLHDSEPGPALEDLTPVEEVAAQGAIEVEAPDADATEQRLVVEPDDDEYR